MNISSVTRIIGASAVLAALSPAALRADCEWMWLPLSSGLDGPVKSLALWDPDGPGPRTPLVVVGGFFTHAGGLPASHIATWDPVTEQWGTLGAGVNELVNAIAAAPDGTLYAGGRFFLTNGQPVNFIAKWDGNQWSPLGSGTDEFVDSLAWWPGHGLVVGGQFGAAGGVAAKRVALWDGSAWSALGQGMDHGQGSIETYALAALPDGGLVTGGSFVEADGHSVSNITRWNGSSWAPMGPGVNDIVLALAVRSGGDLAVGGRFTRVNYDDVELGQWSRIAKWNSGWSGMGTTADLFVNAPIMSLTALAGDDVVAGGFFTTIGGINAAHIARCHNNTWSPLYLGVNDVVNALVSLPDGTIIAGGEFTVAGYIPMSYIARWTLPIAASFHPHPQPATTCASGPAVFSVSMEGTPGFLYNWYWNDGTRWWPMGEGDNYGGDLRTYFTAHDVNSSQITLTHDSHLQGPLNVVHAVRCLVNNVCGATYSNPAALTVCIADVDDGSGTGACDGGVTIDDLLYYLGVFALGDIAADVDDGSATGATDGGVTIDDLLYFLARFTAGC